jgi:cytochrome c oxidase subunit 4
VASEQCGGQLSIYTGWLTLSYLFWPDAHQVSGLVPDGVRIMATAISHRLLVGVWAALVIVTAASWWMGRGTEAPYQVDWLITLGVLAVAAVKVWLVIQYFMEVRSAPAWLKRTCNAWLALLFVALWGFYWTAI